MVLEQPARQVYEGGVCAGGGVHAAPRQGQPLHACAPPRRARTARPAHPRRPQTLLTPTFILVLTLPLLGSYQSSPLHRAPSLLSYRNSEPARSYAFLLAALQMMLAPSLFSLDRQWGLSVGILTSLAIVLDFLGWFVSFYTAAFLILVRFCSALLSELIF